MDKMLGSENELNAISKYIETFLCCNREEGWLEEGSWSNKEAIE